MVREEIMMSDLIRREDAIKAIEELPNAYNGWSDAYDKAYIIGTLEEVPSADRPQGEWIKPYGDSRFMCSICKGKENVPTCMGKPSVWDYCPNCGCRMKGADDE